MKRLLALIFAFASLTAAAQYVPGQKNYGNYNVYGSQWLNGDLKLQKCIRSKSDTLIIFTTAAGVVDTVNLRYLYNLVGGVRYLTLTDSVLHTTDTTNAVAIGTNSAPAGTMLRVNDGSVLFEGSTGTTPVSGAGTRFMWIPSKAAFRAGYVNGTQWDDGLVGDYSTAIGVSTTASGEVSTAIGLSTTASGLYSTAMGESTTASGENSTAMGYYTTASGLYSTAMGESTTASGSGSTVMGESTTASGENSTAMGYYTTANSYALFTAGSLNDTTHSISKDSWVSTDPLFQVGNGTEELSRNNALTILKNGTAYIGDASSTTDPILTVSTTDSTTTLIGELTTSDSIRGSYMAAAGTGITLVEVTATGALDSIAALNLAIDTLPHLYTRMISTDTIYSSSGSIQINYKFTLADDASLNLPTGSGFGQIKVDSVGVKKAAIYNFTFDNNGAPDIISNTANVVNTDTDTKFCLYDNGAYATLKNRLGYSVTCLMSITYYKP